MGKIKEELITEATIVAEVYHQLRLRKISVVLEYNLGEDRGRVDMAILISGKPFMYVEVKNRKKDSKMILLEPEKHEGYTKQLRKYLSCGLPVLYIPKKDYIMEAVKLIESKLPFTKEEVKFNFNKKQLPKNKKQSYRLSK